MTTQPPTTPAGAGAGDANAAITTLTLNYWLSVFFSWIPALIFFFTEKGKSSLIDAHNRANLNFQIVRTIVAFAFIIPNIFGGIPAIGWIFSVLLSLVLWVLTILLFVFAIIAAVKGPEEARAGREYKYPFNIEFIK